MKAQLLALAAVLATFAPQDGEHTAPTGPVVGKPAPTIRLNDHLGKAVSIGAKSDMWQVLAFFPKAATPW